MVLLARAELTQVAMLPLVADKVDKAHQTLMPLQMPLVVVVAEATAPLVVLV